jgi:hypothetical protein
MRQRLHIAATASSPEIFFDAERKIFGIRGESYPEDTARFYLPPLRWLKDYLDTAELQEPFVLNLDMPYCNSSSTKVLMDIFYLLETSAKAGRTVTVRWLYDKQNEHAYETGEELREDVEFLHFKLIGHTTSSR